MKDPTHLLTVFLLAMAVAMPVPHAYSSTLALTVFTDKASYVVAESVTVHGNLTHDGSTVQDWPVALEVQDPQHTPVVTRTPQTDTNGAYSLTFQLPSDARLGTYTVYVSANYKKEAANNTTFKLVNICETTVTIGGKDYTITAESNATITNATATRDTLSFSSSGQTGLAAYVNITFPVELNKTEIAVFIDGAKLTPPPYPTSTANGTHYFIYFEFTLSVHHVEVAFAARLVVHNILVEDGGCTVYANDTYANGTNYNVPLKVMIENTGLVPAGPFNTSLATYWTDSAEEYAECRVSGLDVGANATLTYYWHPAHTGYYSFTAFADCRDEMTWSDENNSLTLSDCPVALMGDVWVDHRNDILDIGQAGLAWHSRPGGEYWNVRADLNHDGYINILDIVRITLRWHQTW